MVEYPAGWHCRTQDEWRARKRHGRRTDRKRENRHGVLCTLEAVATRYFEGQEAGNDAMVACFLTSATARIFVLVEVRHGLSILFLLAESAQLIYEAHE
jgi:hypothetical protein